MEQNLPMGKKMWNILRVVFFMLRKGISKRKLMMDLNAMLKRGKSLVFHNHRRGGSHVTSSSDPSCPDEFEFSCSNTPTHAGGGFPFLFNGKKNKQHHGVGACVHAPPTADKDMAAVRGVLEMLNGMGGETASASPFFPGFGRTPLVRPLRITDSPFPLREEEADVDNGHVDRAAEEFIQKFYKNLKQQKKMIQCN